MNSTKESQDEVLKKFVDRFALTSFLLETYIRLKQTQECSEVSHELLLSIKQSIQTLNTESNELI